MTLRISDRLELPVDYVTKTAAILAQRRKGKTYTASVIAEELVEAGLPWVALDPTGAWWGLRSSADGENPGLPVVILGGQHGDVPLERSAGKFVAELVVDEPGWYVIDFSLFESGAAEKQFATEFAQRLYRRKARPGSDFPLHLFVDEADRFIPQRITDRKEGDAAMLGAFETIVRRGGLRGLGTTLISQRAAVVNKNVLEMVDLLVLLRTVGPNDQRAVNEYVGAHGSREQVAALMGSLASLDLGEAWVWEPGADLFERVQVRERRTFNSSATPKPGEARIEPRQLADVDLDAIKEAMAETIEKAKADDPRELRRRIAALERELAQIRAERPEPERIVERVEVPVLGPDAMNRLIAITDLAEDVRQLREDVGALIGQGMRKGLAESVQRAAEPVPTRRPEPRSRPEPRRPHVAAEGIKLGKAERLILTALAQHPTGRTKRQVALLTGYAVKGGSFSNSLSRLRTAGYIGGKGDLRITDEGLSALGGDWEPLPTGRALADYWIAQLGHAEGEILRVLMEAWPESLTKAEAALRTVSSKGEPYDPNGGGFNNSLSRLRTLELVEGKGEFRASDDLMGGE